MVRILNTFIGIIFLCNSHVSADSQNLDSNIESSFVNSDNITPITNKIRMNTVWPFKSQAKNWYSVIQKSCKKKQIPFISFETYSNIFIQVLNEESTEKIYKSKYNGKKVHITSYPKHKKIIDIATEVCKLAFFKDQPNISQLIAITENETEIIIITEGGDMNLKEYLVANHWVCYQKFK